jgi:hypothetical protein
MVLLDTNDKYKFIGKGINPIGFMDCEISDRNI